MYKTIGFYLWKDDRSH